MRDRAIDLLAEEDDLAKALASTWERDPDKPFPRLHAEPDRILSGRDAPWTIDSAPESPDTPVVQASGWGPVVGDGAGLVARLTQLLADGYRVVVAADGEGSADRLAALLRDHGLDLPVHRGDSRRPHPAGRPRRRRPAAPGRHAAGGQAGDRRRERPHRPPPRPPPAAAPPARRRRRSSRTSSPATTSSTSSTASAATRAWSSARIGGVERDYLLVAYKGDDKLYVPSDQIDVLRQYVGGEAPTLHRLGGSDFAKAKSRVRSAVREIAQELVVLYQKRVNAEGYAFGQDTPWQHEMEDAFPYVETPDQRVAIADVKADMERPYPMDRLLCGDVGFGKTEVAIRAAFKAIQDGKQVAVLAPTTLLATQHGNTFADRFAGYPIRVETLSRFLTPAQARDVVEGLESRRRRLRHRHPPPARRAACASRTSGCSSSTRSSASACSTRRR